MANNNNLWVVVGVALVVGLVAGVVGAGITGNTIRIFARDSATNTYGRQEIYTKTEIDAKINCAEISPMAFDIAEGESFTIFGHTTDLIWISTTQVKLRVDGEESNLISSGGSYTFRDGSRIYIGDILYRAVAGTVGRVKGEFIAKC